MLRSLTRFIAAALATLCLAEIADLAWLSYSRATISSSVNKVVIAGTGALTSFGFSFVGVTASDISVTYTDASGNQTTLTQGSGPTQYQISLNAAAPGTIWGIGGIVTYNPSGTPIAAGTTLTILRTVPLTQTVSLANQGAFFPSAVETALDLLAMQIQQLNELYGRAIVVAPSDPAPLALPPAAQRANMTACFDGTAAANMIACSSPASGTISSAMQPVVNAASLGAGRTAFGLGTMATENINAGTCGGATIQDDGSGNARVVLATAADAINQTVTCAYHGTQRIATGPITYTLPRANTLFNGFIFFIYAQTGAETVTPNAADNFVGVASGTSVAIPAGSICAVTTTAAASGVWYLNCNGANAVLAANASANALTITLSAPALQFRSTTLTTGAPVWATPASGLAITLPTGATLGTSSSNVPFRIWIFAAYNAGTPVLGVATCSSSTTIYGCKSWELIQKSGTAIGAGSTSLGTLYTSGTVTNDAVIIIGYADYATGLATAGTWASGPTTLQLCIQPVTCPRPGDAIQTVSATTTTGGTTTSATFVALTSGQTLAITPTSAPNLIRVEHDTSQSQSAAANSALQLSRGTTAATNMIGNTANLNVIDATAAPTTLRALDRPGVTTSTTYAVQGLTSAGTLTAPASGSSGQAIMTLTEIMG